MAVSPVCGVQSENNLVDRISQLPTEVLGDILSGLNLKEVGRSSVLSKRWRDLWKSTARLKFDASLEERCRIGCIDNEDLRRLEKSKFLTWVNQVVRLHERPSIEEFTVKFDLDSSYAHDIDEWIKFMIRKRAKIIELDLAGSLFDEFYSLSKECCDYIQSASNLTNIMCLRSIRLRDVNVDGELLEYLLSKCPCLEMLSVRRSKTLGNLKVVGPHLLLKYLEIHSCKTIQTIKLCAPKLEKFVYYGEDVKFDIGSNPNLVEFHMGGFREELTCALVPFQSLFSQLEILELGIYFDGDGRKDIPNIREFINLKHLTLKFNMYRGDGVLTAYTKLLVAAPVLAKFTVVMEPGYIALDKLGRSRALPIQPHGCLKEVEILGYGGGIADFEMARYLLKNAINLEKMVLDPTLPYYKVRLDEFSLASIDKDVKELKEGLPPRAQLIVVGM